MSYTSTKEETTLSKDALELLKTGRGVYELPAKDIIHLPNFDKVVAAYHELNQMHLDLTKFDPEVYPEAERVGALKAAAVIADGKCVGFVAVTTFTYDHAGAKMGAVESLFILAQYREFGIALINKAAALAKSAGCKGMLISAPIGSRLEQLFRKHGGYKATNTVFWREL